MHHYLRFRARRSADASTTRGTLARWARSALFLAREVGLERALIFLKAVVVIGIFLYQVWWIHLHFARPGLPLPLSLAVSFLRVQFVVVLAEILASTMVKKVSELR